MALAGRGTHTPVGGPGGPEHREAGQGVGQVGVEGRQAEAAQAPQLPRGGPVVALHAIVDDAQRRQQQQQPGQAEAQHSQEPQQACRVGQQDVEDEGQAVICILAIHFLSVSKRDENGHQLQLITLYCIVEIF